MMRPSFLNLTLIFALVMTAPALAENNADVIVRCDEHGRTIFKLRRDCFGQSIALDKKTEKQNHTGAWATIDGDRGVTLIPVLACRDPIVLSGIISTDEQNHEVLTRLTVQQGKCTRLPPSTAFVTTNQSHDAYRVRVTDLGELWISQSVRVSGLAGMSLSGRLAPEQPARALQSASGLTDDEAAAVKAQLAEKKTVPGFAGRVQVGNNSPSRKRRGQSSDTGMKECLCGNGRRVHTQRACVDACGVQTDSVAHDDCDHEGCYWYGEKMSPEAAARRWVDEQRRR